MDWLFMIAFAIFLAALAAVYATKKGRSGTGWFLFAFLIPFGCLFCWPILWYLPSKKQRSEVERLEEEVRIRKARAELAALRQQEVS